MHAVVSALSDYPDPAAIRHDKYDGMDVTVIRKALADWPGC